MPEISRFLGIIIAMYYNDHEPPHFHARYGDFEVTIRIADGIVEGRFPRRALTLVMEWYALHQDELMADWRLARERRPLRRIEPLEQAMTPKLEAAEYAGGFALRLRFANGREGTVDLRDQLWGEVFEPLHDPDAFCSFRLDPELNTIVWPSGADFAPEFLYGLLDARPHSAASAASPSE